MNDFQKISQKQISPKYRYLAFCQLDERFSVVFASEGINAIGLNCELLNESAPFVSELENDDDRTLLAHLALLSAKNTREIFDVNLSSGEAMTCMCVIHRNSADEAPVYRCYFIPKDENEMQTLADACKYEAFHDVLNMLERSGLPAVVSRGDSISFANSAFAEISGYDRRVLHSMRLSKIVSKRDRAIYNAIENGETVSGPFETVFPLQDGGSFQGMGYSVPLDYYDKTALTILRSNATDKKHALDAELYSSMLASIDDAICIFANARQPFWLNSSFEKLLGYNKDTVSRYLEQLEDSFGEEISESIKEYGYWYKMENTTRLNGTGFCAEFHLALLPTGYFGLRVKNANEKIETAKLLRTYKSTDYLTGVDNSITFLNKLHEAYSDASLNEERLDLIMFSVINYTDVFFSVGSDTADALLKMTAQRAKGFSAGAKRSVARLGEFRFGLMFNSKDDQDALDTLREFMSFMDVSIIHNNNTYYAKVYAGMSSFPDYSSDVFSLYCSAKNILHTASKSGRPTYAYYSKTGTCVCEHKSSFEYDVEKSIENDDFYVEYQPVVDVNTNKPVSFEALLRTKTPVISNSVPASFMQAAEATGALVSISYKTLEEVAKFQHFRKSENKSFVPIIYNMDLCQLLDRNLLKYCDKIFGQYELDKDDVLFQVSMDNISWHTRDMLAAIRRFVQKGYRLTVNRYSSKIDASQMLSNLGVNLVSFSKKAADNILKSTPKHLDAVRAFVDSAHKTGMKVSIVGIETDEQLQLIRSLGFDFYQGFLFSRPVKYDGVISLLDKTTDILPVV